MTRHRKAEQHPRLRLIDFDLDRLQTRLVLQQRRFDFVLQLVRGRRQMPIDLRQITDETVRTEIGRLERLWRPGQDRAREADDIDLSALMGEEAARQLDLFDAVQLQSVIRVCRQSRSLSDAGRTLFAVSRSAKEKPNDADRLKKYLARFGLAWDHI